jgi:hypothetical protein
MKIDCGFFLHDEICRLAAIESRNNRQKKIFTDQSLDREICQDALGQKL